MKVEVAYALPERQWLVALELADGATAQDAVARSGVLELHPTLVADRLRLGIFGRIVALDQALRDGDRVEILRPLLADPKEVRRNLAAEGRAMGRRRPAVG